VFSAEKASLLEGKTGFHAKPPSPQRRGKIEVNTTGNELAKQIGMLS
jgi:hypothetical protein